MKELDGVDLRILEALQHDCSGTIAEVAERACVSQTPCWRRIRRLEEEGVIRSRVALLNASALELGITAFVLVRTASHDEKWLSKFSNGVAKIPEVLEVHRMAGEIDYLLKVVAKDVEDYDRIYKQLITVADLLDVSASFSMEKIKETTALPLRTG
ncbi:MAG: Lrp/AsnC family transcriptional regulator [Pseudomonadota bacterium]